MPQQRDRFDLYTVIAGGALERRKPFRLECNCGGVVTIMPPFQDEYVVCPRCEARIKMLVIEGDPGYINTGAYLAQAVSEISRPRFSTRVLRKQIGVTVLSVTADAAFVVKGGNTLKKVRAEKLEVGMILASGEKVYQ